MPRVANARQPHPDDFSVEDMKPTAHAVKHQEMAIRRAFELNAGLLEMLSKFGTLDALIDGHRDAIYRSKELKNLFTFDSVEWRHKDVWEWVVRHWYDGGLKRSVEASMQNITSTNKKAIKEKVDVLHG